MIRAILFDSGKVLNYPAMGNWFISPQFFDIVDADIFKGISRKKVHCAFRNAEKYISGILHIQDKSAELMRFTEFYRIFSNCLPELKLDQSRIESLAKDLVNNPKKYIFYSDVFSVIPELNKKYKLGIVSDAWPSLVDVYENANLKKYFSTVIISSVLGTQKPDRRMYETALEDLHVRPQETIFIDDNDKNCAGAKQVGITPYLLCRSLIGAGTLRLLEKFKRYRVINSLNSLRDL